MRSIQTVGIVGAGTMGSALAQKFAQEGLAIILVDRTDSFLRRALSMIQATLNEGVQRKLFTPQQTARIVDQITCTTRLEKLSHCQLVIEAVFEDLTVKTTLFQKLSTILDPQAILATNTSSFSVDELSQHVTPADRFLGLHFFYHAAKNRLVEIIRGSVMLTKPSRVLQVGLELSFNLLTRLAGEERRAGSGLLRGVTDVHFPLRALHTQHAQADDVFLTILGDGVRPIEVTVVGTRA